MLIRSVQPRVRRVLYGRRFTFIMPTILKVYSSHTSSPVVCNVINFACRQFLLLHRNPFVLQVGPLLLLLLLLENLWFPFKIVKAFFNLVFYITCKFR